MISIGVKPRYSSLILIEAPSGSLMISNGTSNLEYQHQLDESQQQHLIESHNLLS